MNTGRLTASDSIKRLMTSIKGNGSIHLFTCKTAEFGQGPRWTENGQTAQDFIDSGHARRRLDQPIFQQGNQPGVVDADGADLIACFPLQDGGADRFIEHQQFKHPDPAAITALLAHFCSPGPS